MLFNANLKLIGLAKLLKLLVKGEMRTGVIFINMDTTHRGKYTKESQFYSKAQKHKTIKKNLLKTSERARKAPLLQWFSSLCPPNRNSHLARAIFCDRDGGVSELRSDCMRKTGIVIKLLVLWADKYFVFVFHPNKKITKEKQKNLLINLKNRTEKQY